MIPAIYLGQEKETKIRDFKPRVYGGGSGLQNLDFGEDEWEDIELGEP